MPLYDYRCSQCGKIFEIRHGFDQVHTQPCAACGGALVRVFNAAPILFKGSGFYATDSRKAAPADGSAKAGDSPKPEPPAKGEGAAKSESAAPAPAGESKKASDSAA